MIKRGKDKAHKIKITGKNIKNWSQIGEKKQLVRKLKKRTKLYCLLPKPLGISY